MALTGGSSLPTMSRPGSSTWEPIWILAISRGGPEAVLRTLPDCAIVPAGQLPQR